MAKVTVAIPAYRTRFLVEAISSVLTQSFTDFELLISDDSADRSVADLVGRFRDPRIRLIEGPRRGPARNSAHIWENASAPFLKFLHDDDKLYPNALAELLRVIEKDERHLFAFSHRDVIDDYGRLIRKPQQFNGETFELPVLAEFMVSRMVNPVGEPTAMLVRRSHIPDASVLHRFAGLEISNLSEVAFVLNVVNAGSAIASGERLCAIRQHREQVSANRADPAYPRGLFEWEICLRGAVQAGLITPQAAVGALPRLDALYVRQGSGFEEIDRFRAGLPQLRDLLAAGRTDVVDDGFKAAIAFAEQSAQLPARRAPAIPASPYDQAGERRARLTVEQLTRRRARGWAWLPEAPEKSVRVEVLAGARVVGQAVADLERADLRDVGTGRYGFDLVFEEPILGDDLPVLRVVLDEEEFSPGNYKFPPLEQALKSTEGGGAVLREHARFTTAGPQFEEFQPAILADRPKLVGGEDPLVLAFYLSQFHAIPENDEHWGAGFTEWRQLARAAPRFPGHYQPRIPRDLGFYNLLDPEVMRRQVEFATAAGVGAFGFYYYWFDQKRVLERPIEQFLGSDIEMPFLLIWANENWTRAWDGGDRDVLLEQRYRIEDEDALLADLARHMLDPRYVRIAGRPLFVIYNASSIPETEKTVDRWRRKWESEFGLQPLIFMAQVFNRNDPRPYGLDGALEFPPHKLSARTQKMEVLDAFSSDFRSTVISYDDIVGASLTEPPSQFPLIKTALPGWDNDARRPNRGVTLAASAPAKYGAWLQNLIEAAIERPLYGRPVVAVNAWNEWAEGAHLEPDVYYGAAYLNATARALKGAILKKNLEREALAARRGPAGEPSS
ncbi:glycoside hydrolase family 99-like domain-containing protein [Phenylobacterium sp. LjRoot225]|uniref:glycoside hydrolase family 99-like domain-containing protein n=1 Tax=Phenylobacterium sp. LjRoot225 TaxID=3342285 RepID=UPI003ECF7F77